MNHFLTSALVIVSLFLSSQPAHAEIYNPPESLVDQALSATVNVVMAGFKLNRDDFEVELVGPKNENLEIFLVEKSLDWTRVGDLFVVPRGLLNFKIKSAESLILKQGKSQTELGSTNHLIQGIAPVVLLMGKENQISLNLKLSSGEVVERKLAIHFRPKKSFERVSIDSSCSSFEFNLNSSELAANEWVHVGCRLVYSKSTGARDAVLEVFWIWQKESADEVTVNSLPLSAQPNSSYLLNLTASSGRLEIKSKSSQWVINPVIPKRLHALSVGVGLGPYLYKYNEQGSQVNTPAALITLYASYFLSEKSRFVAFNASPIHSVSQLDLGLYLWFEQASFLDRRITANLLLGANALWYPTVDGLQGRITIPQGFELIAHDFILRGANLSLGGFFYPLISGRQYYNSWMRFGRRGMFVEMNYINWQETLSTQVVQSSALGLSVGVPLFQAL